MTLIPNICTWISKGHIGMRIVVVFLFVLVAFGAGFMLLTRSPDEPASEAPTSLALMRDEAASKKLIDRNEVPGDVDRKPSLNQARAPIPRIVVSMRRSNPGLQWISVMIHHSRSSSQPEN